LKAKPPKSEIPIYGALNSAPLSLDSLIAAARTSGRAEVVQLAEWVWLVQSKIDTQETRSEEARQLAEKCRSALSDMLIYTYAPPLTEDAIYAAMLRALELGALYQSYAAANNLPMLIQTRLTLSDAGKKGAAKRHGSVREKNRKNKQTKALRLADEWRASGVLEPAILKRLAKKLGVKIDTAKRIVKKNRALTGIPKDSSR